MSNQISPIVEASFAFRANPPPPTDKNEPPKEVKVALDNIPQESWIVQVSNTLLAFGIRKSLSKLKEWDDEILPVIFKNTSDLTQTIKEITPRLFEVILPALPKEIQDFLAGRSDLGEEFSERLLIRVMINLSLSLLPDELKEKIINGERNIPEENKISVEALPGRLFDKLIHPLGAALNAVDKRVMEEEKTQDFKVKALEEVFDLLLPPGDGFRGGVLESVFNVKDIFVEKAYGFISKWLKKEETLCPPTEKPVDLTPLHSDINKCIKYLNTGFQKKWQDEDGGLFKKLTGADDDSIFKKRISELYEKLSQFFPKELAAIFQKEKTENSLEETTKTFLLHAVATLAKEVFQKELAEGQTVAPQKLIDRVLSHLASKIREQFEEVHQNEAKGEVPSASDFAPLSKYIINLFLPKVGPNKEYQWLHDLIERHQEEFTGTLHHILHAIYLSQPAGGKVEEYKERLKAVFQGKVGSESAVEQIYNLSSNLAALFQGPFESFLKDSEKFFEEPGKSLDASSGQKDSQVGWVQEKMQKALEYMIFRSFVHWFEKVPEQGRGEPGQLLMHAFQRILSIGMNHLPRITAELETQKAKILPKIWRQFNNPESKGYSKDKEKRKNDVDGEVNKRLEALGTRLLQPFLDEFMGVFFENEHEILEDQIPFIGEFNNPLCQWIRSFLSKQVCKMMMVTTSWMQDRTKNETRLGELYPTKNPMKLCNILGHMAREGLSSKLREESWANEIVMPFFKPYFCPPDAPANCDVDLALLQKMFQGFFRLAGTTNSPVILQLMDFIGDFAETSLLRLMADFSKRFKTMEEVNADPPPYSQVIEDSKREWTANASDKSRTREETFAENKIILKSLITNPEITDQQLFAFIKFAKIKSRGKFLTRFKKVFQASRGVKPSRFIKRHEIKNQSLLEGSILRLLDYAKDHFEVLGKIPNGSKLTRSEIISEFERAGKLHSAVREGKERDDFFKKLSHQIFKIIGVTEKTYLPIPGFLKKSVWPLIEDKLIPLMLVKAMEVAKEPSNLNKMIVAAMLKSEEALKDNEDSIWSKLMPDENQANLSPQYQDAYQSKLDARIKGVIDAVTQLREKSFARKIMNVKVQGMPVLDKAATAVGQSFRAVFRDENYRHIPTLDLLDTLMGVISDSIVEVEWEENKIVYPKTEFDGRKSITSNGSVEYVQKPCLAKIFPKTEQEKNMAETLAKEARRKAKKEVPYYLRTVISAQAKSFLRDQFLQSCNRLEAKLKEKCPNLSKVLLPLFTFLIKIPLVFTVIFLLDGLIWIVVNIIFQAALGEQIKKYTKDANVDVYDNLIYKYLDFGMNKVVENIEQVYVEDEATDSADDESQEESDSPLII